MGDLLSKAEYFLNKHARKFRFLIVGALNTAVGLAVYPILYLLLPAADFGYMKILLISQFICITFSYMSNKYLVFKTSGNFKKEYVKFLTFHLSYLFINIMALPIMVESFSMNPMIAQTVFAVAVIITSYAWHTHITFKTVKDKA